MTTINQKIGLLRGLLSGEVAKAGPFYVDIDVTQRCNLRCVGCPFHGPHVKRETQTSSVGVDIPLDLFKKLCVELKSMKTNSLIIQGSGEPLLNPDIFEMISTAKDAGFSITLLTNGTLLNSDTIKALIDVRLDILRVSLLASSVEQYRKNYPGNDPDNFRKVIDGLNRVTKLKAQQKSTHPTTLIYYIINHYNFQTINEMVDLAVTTGCDGLYFTPMFNVRGELTSFMLSPEEGQHLQLALCRARKRLKSLSMSHNFNWALSRYKMTDKALWEHLPCYIAWFHVRISTDGRVLPCGRCNDNIYFGNLHENTLQEIWNGPLIREFRRKAFSKKEFESIVGKNCNCKMCCYFRDSESIHQVFKWINPFVRLLKS